MLAEAADASEAATMYLQRIDTTLAGCPVVMLGFSTEPLLSPTAAAWLGDRCTAMVLIASGCNLMATAEENELTHTAVFW